MAEVILKQDQSQIYQRTKKSRCCVHLAVITRHKPLLMMLLRNGGSKYTNAIDCNNRTPLHYAAALGDSEVCGNLELRFKCGLRLVHVVTLSWSAFHPRITYNADDFLILGAALLFSTYFDQHYHEN